MNPFFRIAASKFESPSVPTHPSADPDVVASLLDDVLVLIHLRTNRIYELNRTGARYWELLTDGLDRAAIEAQILGEFDVEPAALTQEMDALHTMLVAEKLIRGSARS